MTVVGTIAACRVVPVVEIDDASGAVSLARALVAGGLPLIEVTLRTAAGLEAIRVIAREVPEMQVGAGTILDRVSAERAVAAGARFLVSPGFTSAISTAAHEAGLPLFPGAVTATEVLAAREAGHHTVKFFPAEASGGIAALRALGAPFGHTGVQFMPTGGIRLDTLAPYLRVPGVLAVGGTWVASRRMIEDHAWSSIEDAAAAAVAVVHSLAQETSA